MYRQPRLSLNAKAPVSILRRALSRNRNPIPKLTIPYGRHLSFRQARNQVILVREKHQMQKKFISLSSC